MKKFVLGICALAGVCAGQAFAADMPVKARPAPAAPVYVQDWTGFYVGIAGGYGWSSGATDVTGTPVGFGIGAGAPQTLAASIAALPGRVDPDPKGAIFGGQFGYNRQVGRLVWGFETDISWADFDGSVTQAATAPITGFAVSVTDVTTVHSRLDLFGTVRGRLGYTITAPLLIYATGGLAYGHVKSETNVVATFVPVQAVAFNSPSSSSSTTRVGWTVGGGLEYAFAPHWTVKGEYLYYDLGNVDYSSSLISGAGGAVFTNATVNTHARFNGSIARIGVNYKFDGLFR